MKLIFKSIIVCAIIAICLYFNYNKKTVSPLLLENIEALASGESGGDVTCIGFGTVDCPISSIKVYTVYEPFFLRNNE